jgi:hypothetical protein
MKTLLVVVRMDKTREFVGLTVGRRVLDFSLVGDTVRIEGWCEELPSEEGDALGTCNRVPDGDCE